MRRYFEDRAGHSIRPFEKLPCPEASDFDSGIAKDGSANLVVTDALEFPVLIAIDFDGEHCLSAEVIEDEPCVWMLAAELEAADSAIAHQLPEFSLGVTRPFSHRSREAEKAFIRIAGHAGMMILEIGPRQGKSQSQTLTPALSRVQEREQDLRVETLIQVHHRRQARRPMMATQEDAAMARSVAADLAGMLIRRSMQPICSWSPGAAL